MSNLEKAWAMEKRKEIDAEIARMFYTGGLPFSLSKNPHFRKSYNMLSNSGIKDYVCPEYNSLRTKLLCNEKSNVDLHLNPIRDSWATKGVSVCSDGWSDVQRRQLINVMAHSENGPMFIRAVNTQGHTKDRFYISELLIEDIKKIGPQNVVQVITDNASNCKSAGGIIEKEFPHIFWTPCVVHTLNLALKNICAPQASVSNTLANDAFLECSWITYLADDASFIKNFIMNHSKRLFMFNENSNLKFLSIADTRFASTIVLLKRFKKIKQSLKQMVISEEWDAYREKEDDGARASTVRMKILSDCFWEKINFVLAFTEPIYDMLRKADTDEPFLHLIYEWWDSMIESVREAIYKHEGKDFHEESKLWEVVERILIERWTKSYTPLHCLAHSLNPKFYSTKWLQEKATRVTPDQDREINLERMKCLERYFPRQDQRRAICKEFTIFADMVDVHFPNGAREDRYFLTPKEWWSNYGSAVPNLKRLASKVLSQPASSSCCERNWSTYKFIHSHARNRLTPKRAEDLVFVHSNLRLLSRKTPQYKEGPTKMWDIGGEILASNDNDGLLEIANLSLDDPELEVMIVEEVDDEDERNFDDNDDVDDDLEINDDADDVDVDDDLEMSGE